MSKYQAYPEYKDTGIDWLPKVPTCWQVLPVKLVLMNKVKDGPHETPVFIEEGVPFLSVDGIQDGKLVFEGCRYISQEDHERYSKKCLPKYGDILLGKAASVGKVAFVDTEQEFNVWSPLAVLTPKTVKFGRFLYYSLQSTWLQAQCDVSSNSNTQKNLSMGVIDNLLFPIPIDDVAEEISNFLDHETAKIDTLIDKQQQLIQLLKEKRQAVISHAVTKGLNPNAPMRDSGVEWLGEVPEHWGVAGFKKYLNKIIDYRGKTPEKHDSGVFLVTARNIKNGLIDYSASQEYVSLQDYESVMSRGKPKLGDILFTTEAPLGEVATVDRLDIALAQRVIKFDGVEGILNNEYLKYFIMSSQFQASLIMFSSGSTALGIKAERLVYLRKLLPPYKEQLEIVIFIEETLKKLDALIKKALSVIELMQERRTALISAAVTGKIDVRHHVSRPTGNDTSEVSA